MLNRRSSVHRAFALLCASFAVWALGTCGQNLSVGSAALPLFDRITFFGAEIFALAGAVFVIRLTSRSHGRWAPLYLAGSCVALAVSQYMNWTRNAIVIDFPAGAWYFYHKVAINVIILIGLLLIFLWARTSRFKREKMQAALIIVSTLICTPIGTWMDVSLGLRHLSSLSCLMPILWLLSILFAITRYGLLNFTPALVSREILSGITEAIILFDADWAITDLNNAALEALGERSARTRPARLSDVFMRAQPLVRCLQAMSQDDVRTCDRTELLRTKSGKPVMVRAVFNLITDNWGDRIGVLCICHFEERLEGFMKKRRLSAREADILRHTLSGCSQSEIAECLGLSLPTIKTHTRGLYNKLGISNRGELFALLRHEDGAQGHGA